MRQAEALLADDSAMNTSQGCRRGYDSMTLRPRWLRWKFYHLLSSSFSLLPGQVEYRILSSVTLVQLIILSPQLKPTSQPLVRQPSNFFACSFRRPVDLGLGEDLIRSFIHRSPVFVSSSFAKKKRQCFELPSPTILTYSAKISPMARELGAPSSTIAGILLTQLPVSCCIGRQNPGTGTRLLFSSRYIVPPICFFCSF
jgi:hypothetical protein